MTSIKRPVLFLAAAGITALLGVQYLRVLRPAQAREIQNACRRLSSADGVRPDARNRVLGDLPTKAPDFAAQDHTGKIVHLSDLRGKVVLLRFWASWCNTCKAEQPSLEDLAGDIDTDEVEVLSVAADSDWEAIRKKLKDGSNTTVLIDPPSAEEGIGPVGMAYGVQKVPESFIIDRDGIVRYYIVNKRDWRGSVARTCLRSILDE